MRITELSMITSGNWIVISLNEWSAFIQRTLFSFVKRLALRSYRANYHNFAQSFIYNEIRFIDNRVKKIFCCFRWILTSIYRYESRRVSFIRPAEQYSILKSVSHSALNDCLLAFPRRNITACGMEQTWKEGAVNKCPAKKERKKRVQSFISATAAATLTRESFYRKARE